ncbi:MAG TPA: DNA ligase D [Thermoanaerobaculia bacterium]|jgi:bifunctional non-homologous end joining protein LigD|nr:DNA ligase D [Thermoanaerobaculia bacterium]
MGLGEYQRKRDFARTPEPHGRARKDRPQARQRPALRFVIQKHAARRLHYDFRLELDGVLKSWAVPKGPSLDPADKRLAVEVEDHPLDYGDFEGVIPQGQYGGGSVLLWDRGTWQPEGDARRDLERGKLEFSLAGEKLHGRWLLVRTGKDGGKQQWLLRKLADDAARRGSDGAVTEQRPESVQTGRTLEEIGKRPARVWRSHRAKTPAVDPANVPGARRGALPEFVPPQLATLVDEPPRGEGWLHEIKLDGYRALCRLENGGARFITRRGNDWTDSWQRLASAAAFLPAGTALLDGEVVWMGADGRTDFQGLQQASGGGSDDRLLYFAFDLLHLDGYDLSHAALLARKQALQALLAAIPPPGREALRYSDHVEGEGRPFFAQACRHHLEGIVCKRADAPSRSGRGRDWLKVKCLAEQELVIVGYTEPRGSRQGLGALLLGVHEPGARRRPGALRFAGKVGTGFDDATLHDLLRRLRPLERATPAVVNPPRGYKARGVHWVEPQLVAQVAFTAWTADGVLRHPTFRGLRADKEASEVVREVPAEAEDGSDRGRAAGAVKKRRGAARPAATGARQATRAKAPAAKAAAKRRPAAKAASTTTAVANRPASGKRASPGVEVAGVRISNPDRVLYPELGLTKLELVRYYQAVADRMLPYLDGRPLTLLRCPGGRDKPCFYQKHLADATPPELVEVPVVERGGEHSVYVAVESVPALLALPQMGVLEIHPWGSRRQHLEKPDVLIFDLDPGPGVDWSDCVGAARDLRALLRELGLESFAKLSGGKGVHVVVPIIPQLAWDPAKAFCRAVVQLLASREPERYVTVMAKAKRPGKIFLDYLRNGFGNTAVAPYSTRARPGAPVAAPIRWEELTARLRPDHYTVRNLPRRLKTMRRDPWEEFFTQRQRVPKSVLRQLGV